MVGAAVLFVWVIEDENVKKKGEIEREGETFLCFVSFGGGRVRVLSLGMSKKKKTITRVCLDWSL